MAASPAPRKHIRKIHILIISGHRLLRETEHPRPLYVVFGINGVFYRTSMIISCQPEWHQMEEFDLLTLHVSVRDTSDELARGEVQLSDLNLEGTSPSKLILWDLMEKDLIPYLVYRCHISEYRAPYAISAVDWTQQRLPLLCEPLVNLPFVETRCLCLRRKGFEKDKQIVKDEALVVANPFITAVSGIFGLSASSVLEELEPAHINNFVPTRCAVGGGQRVIIGGCNFGENVSNIRLLLIAGCDCTHYIQSHSPNRIHVLTRRFAVTAGPVVVVTKLNGTAISDMSFTFFDLERPPKLRKTSVMPTTRPIQFHNAECQTDEENGVVVEVPSGETPTIQSPAAITLVNTVNDLREENQLLRAENQRQKIYLDQLTTRIMEMCPAIFLGNNDAS